MALLPEKMVNKGQSLLRLTFFLFSWPPHVAQIQSERMAFRNTRTIQV